MIALIYFIISILAMKIDIYLLNEEKIKIDVLLAILFCTLLVLMKLNIKESNKKIVKFLQRNYLNIIVFIIFCLSTTNLTYNAANNMKAIRIDASPVEQDIYAIITNTYERLIKNLKQYDNGLYRVVTKFQNGSNDSLTYGYNGVSYSGSTYSKKLHTFLEKLGMRKSHVQVLCDLENTKTVDMLLGIKYLIVAPNQKLLKNYPIAYEEIYIENNIKIHENPYNLSLGYIVDKNIFNTNMNNVNTFELQNEMLKNMTDIQEDVYKKHEGEINEEIEEIEKNGIRYIVDGENPKITYEIVSESNDNMYLYLLAKGDNGVNVFIDGEESLKHSAFANNEMINVGKKEKGQKVTIEIVTDGDIEINKLYVYYENEDILKKHYDKLKENQVQVEKIDNRRYKGAINIEEDNQYVMFTIPYEKGWTIKVDGEKVEYKEVLDALIALNLNKGEHEITLEFMPDGMLIGMISTISGIIILVFLKKKINI